MNSGVLHLAGRDWLTSGLLELLDGGTSTVSFVIPLLLESGDSSVKDSVA